MNDENPSEMTYIRFLRLDGWGKPSIGSALIEVGTVIEARVYYDAQAPAYGHYYVNMQGPYRANRFYCKSFDGYKWFEFLSPLELLAMEA